MEDRIDKIDTLLSNVAAFLVARYGMSARDAACIVMTSSVAKQLYSLNSEMEDYSIEEIANLLKVA